MAYGRQILRPSKDFLKDDDKTRGVLNGEIACHDVTPFAYAAQGEGGVYIDVYAMHTEGGGGGQNFPKFCVCNT